MVEHPTLYALRPADCAEAAQKPRPQADRLTRSHYFAELADDGAALGDVLDRQHDGLQRRRLA